MWGYLVALIVVLSACSPPEPGRVVTDVALSPDGEVVEIDVNNRSDVAIEPALLTAIGQQSEACLDDGTCIRLVDERRIEESTDNWATSSVVWEISPASTWWRHHYDDGYNPVVIGLFDIVVTPEQEVAVAGGQLPLIRRSSEGEWTPTVGELRELPGVSGVPVFLGGYVLLLGAFGAWRRRDDAIVFSASVMILPHLALGLVFTLVAPTGIAVPLLALLIAPLILASLGLGLGAILRERPFALVGAEPSLLSSAVRVLGPGVGWVLLTFVTYQLWSTDRARFDVVGLSWIVSFVIAAAVVARWRRTDSGRASASPKVALGSTIALAVIGAYLAVIATLFGSVWFPAPALFPTLVASATIGLIARRTARLGMAGKQGERIPPPPM